MKPRYAPYFFLAPFFALFGVFMVYPLFDSIRLSTYSVRGMQNQTFVGLENIERLIADPLFWTALWNTAYFAAGSLLLQLPVALALALLLSNARLKGRNLFRLSFFSPVLISGVFIAVIFYLLYDRRYGLVNRVLGSEIPWLQDPDLVMPALVLAGVWRWAGFNMVYFLAGLQSIRQELYEAAAVDGAGPWQSFVHVTVPALKPVIAFVVITSMIGSFQLFDLPYVLTEGGPGNASMTMVMYLYKHGFEFINLGYAATIGWALAVIIGVISIIQVRFFGVLREN
ncbi:MAG: sugar ABC transporter permease [Gemmatimonadetes bacterium]|nr:sugar ABC transporter permease [Gemmatimonadota bacterium]MYG83802.1 sugar ABC transporter permease [Gemmatimonadota bacterium]MYJ90633.1 sugar ABC transporter permease [Gemmatimonadota bacterium]